jgi:hypothetical protein
MTFSGREGRHTCVFVSVADDIVRLVSGKSLCRGSWICGYVLVRHRYPSNVRRDMTPDGGDEDDLQRGLDVALRTS